MDFEKIDRHQNKYDIIDEKKSYYISFTIIYTHCNCFDFIGPFDSWGEKMDEYANNKIEKGANEVKATVHVANNKRLEEVCSKTYKKVDSKS